MMKMIPFSRDISTLGEPTRFNLLWCEKRREKYWFKRIYFQPVDFPCKNEKGLQQILFLSWTRGGGWALTGSVSGFAPRLCKKNTKTPTSFILLPISFFFLLERACGRCTHPNHDSFSFMCIRVPGLCAHRAREIGEDGKWRLFLEKLRSGIFFFFILFLFWKIFPPPFFH